MSVSLLLNSKAVTWSVWGILTVLFAAMLLYANQAPIALYTMLAKPVPTENATGAPSALGSAEMFW